jgi:hypothetical protein
LRKARLGEIANGQGALPWIEEWREDADQHANEIGWAQHFVSSFRISSLFDREIGKGTIIQVLRDTAIYEPDR